MVSTGGTGGRGKWNDRPDYDKQHTQANDTQTQYNTTDYRLKEMTHRQIIDVKNVHHKSKKTLKMRFQPKIMNTKKRCLQNYSDQLKNY